MPCPWTLSGLRPRDDQRGVHGTTYPAQAVTVRQIVTCNTSTDLPARPRSFRQRSTSEELVTRPSAPLGPPTPSRARGWLVVPALLVVVLAWGLTACSGPASAQTGDCVERSGDDSYVAVDCSTAQLRVLERQEDLAADCATVAGVTEGYVDYTAGYQLCLGPLDADPATAVNVADVGDCLAGADAGTGVTESDVHQVDCADPSAGAQVLSRSEDVLPIGFECDDVAGSTAGYSWSLDETSTGDTPIAPLNITDILFCLGPPGVDPQASPDTAQVGDCLTGDRRRDRLRQAGLLGTGGHLPGCGAGRHRFRPRGGRVRLGAGRRGGCTEPGRAGRLRALPRPRLTAHGPRRCWGSAPVAVEPEEPGRCSCRTERRNAGPSRSSAAAQPATAATCSA